MNPQKLAVLEIAKVLHESRLLTSPFCRLDHLTGHRLFCDCHRSPTQAVRALAEDLQDKLEAQEIYPRRKEGFRESRWIVLDYSSVIVHIFHPEEREYYNIERLWTDGSNRIALHFQDE